MDFPLPFLTRYRILLQSRLERIEFPQFRFVRQAILQLSERGQQSCTIRFQLPILAAQTKLDSEPEALKIRKYTIKKLSVAYKLHATHRRQLLDIIIWCS